MTDSTRLTRNAAAFDGRNDIELTDGAGNIEGLIDDELESLKAEIIVYISAVDLNGAAARNYAYTGDGFLSSACSVEIRHCAFVHFFILPLFSELVNFRLLSRLLVSITGINLKACQ